MTLIPEKYQRDCLIYAFRYALGRETYAVSTVQEIIKNAWPVLSEFDKALFKREIEEAERLDLLGNDSIDKPGWVEIANLKK